jgi:hypothetical protein
MFRSSISKAAVLLVFLSFLGLMISPAGASGRSDAGKNIRQLLKGDEKTGPGDIQRLVRLYDGGKTGQRKEALARTYYYKVKAKSAYDPVGGWITVEIPAGDIVFTRFRLHEREGGYVQSSFFYVFFKQWKCIGGAKDAGYYFVYSVKGTRALKGRKVLEGNLKGVIVADDASGTVCMQKEF